MSEFPKYTSPVNGSTFDCYPDDFDLMKEFLSKVTFRTIEKGGFETSQVAAGFQMDGKSYIISATFEMRPVNCYCGREGCQGHGI